LIDGHYTIHNWLPLIDVGPKDFLKMFALLSLMTFCLTNPHFHLLWQRIFFNFPFFQAGENENENENENETETRSKHN